MKKYIVGITGASGSIYAIRFIEELLKRDYEVHIVCTSTGEKVINHETGYSFNKLKEHFGTLEGKAIFYDVEDLFAPIASGSFKIDGMVVIPCSMSTLAEISNGLSKNLLTRAADVCIKEKRNLIIVPRETPVSSIHLGNMLTLSNLGVTILPASPGFYHMPKSMEDIINFVVGKTLDLMNINNNLFEKWGN